MSEEAKLPSEKELLDSLKGAAEPELRKIADETKTKFLADVSEFCDESNMDKLGALLDEASDAYIKSVTVLDEDESQQWADVADAKMRSVAQLTIAEKIVASREIAAMLQSAALAVWGGFKAVALGVFKVTAKTVLATVIPGIGGAIGGAVVDAVADSFQDDPTGSA